MEEDTSLLELCVEEDVIQALCNASNSSTLEQSLETLIEVARTEDGRSDLASKLIVTMIVRLVQSLPYPSGRHFLVSSLRLLRNLCAGELANQSLFVEHNGVGAVSNVFRSARVCSEEDCGIIRNGLQILANVSLAGEEFQRAIWSQLFPAELLALAKIRRREVCDPLSMIIYTCGDGNSELPIVREIVKTTATVGYGEDWLKLLISRICLEGPHFRALFSESSLGDVFFTPQQAFLLRMSSDVLNERIAETDFTVAGDFGSCIFDVFKSSIAIIDSGIRTGSGLPTGSTEVDVLGYSLTILRDISARASERGSDEDFRVSVETLTSRGLVKLLLNVLRDLEPPAMIKKAMNGEQVRTSSSSAKPCPYKGFRRDIVSVIGNCLFGRKNVQEEIRDCDGILLLLQQCVVDEENPFLREWGIWTMRNLLGGNPDNQRAVEELALQGAVDTPELAGLGLKLEVDPNSGRPKLVNVAGVSQNLAR